MSEKIIDEYVHQNRNKFGGKWAILFDPINYFVFVMALYLLSCLMLFCIFVDTTTAFLLAIPLSWLFAFFASRLARKVARKFRQASKKARQEFLQKSSENELLEKGDVQ